MALEGNLETVTLNGILQLLCNENKTGVLRLSNGEEEFQIFFLEGSVIYSIQSRKESRLGYLLMRDGIVTEENINKCLKTGKEKKLAIGKVLVDSGHISKATLSSYIYKQIQEIIATLFLWGKGDFSYIDSKLNLRWLVVEKMNTLQLIMDALRLKDEKINSEE